MFGKSPAIDYLGFTDTWIVAGVDLACACAFWEDENYHYKKSEEKAGGEAVVRTDFLEDMKKKMEDR